MPGEDRRANHAQPLRFFFASWPLIVPSCDVAAVGLASKAEIMGNAAHAVLIQPSRSLTCRFLIDEEALAQAGVTDFSSYLVIPGAEPLPDFFCHDGSGFN